jgi:hypothetical protein
MDMEALERDFNAISETAEELASLRREPTERLSPRARERLAALERAEAEFVARYPMERP